IHSTAATLVNPCALSTPNGTATLDVDGRTIHFTPDLDKNDGNVGLAGFTVTYKANDGSLDSNTATLTISVSAVNDAPVAADDARSEERRAAADSGARARE